MSGFGRFALLVALAGSAAATAALEPLMPVHEIVARHLAARGGVERWHQVETLRATGSYAAFSFRSDFELIRGRGDLFRLDFELLEAPAVRARDAEGVWWQHKLLSPEAARLTEGPYLPQLEREAWFGPPLLDAAQRGAKVELVGSGDVDGIATVNLRLTLADGREELWWLDRETYLEVAVDSTIVDFTQSAEPVALRTFYDDFRRVDGVVVPHQVDWEFGHRLESMTLRTFEVDAPLADGSFAPPPAPDPQNDP